MNVHYSCTQCGDCCRNTKIPLTIQEASAWLADGHPVQVICEAAAWSNEPPGDDLHKAHFRRRSFATTSGTMPARIVVMLVASIVGPCPNLLPDLRCGIYERRPLVCRIYPAEINPVIAMEPGKKACPEDAWAGYRPLFMQGGRLVDEGLRRDIAEWRERDALEVDSRRRLCALLGFTDAAVAGEGFVVYSPPAESLARALSGVIAGPLEDAWRFVSDRPRTIDQLIEVGADARHSNRGSMPYQYIGLRS